MKRDYREFVRAAAQLQGYAFPEREERWLARLGNNQREIDAFHAAPEPGGHPVLMPPPVGVAQPQPLPGGVAKEGPCPASSARGMAEAVRSGKVKARELVEAALAAADRNTHLNAFITLARVQALAAADLIDKRVAAGDAKDLPLAGVPVAIKDLMQVAGLPMTGGSRSVDPVVSAEDAEAVRRLREAGAVVIGTANLHELAYGVTSDNVHFGRVGNPRAPGLHSRWLERRFGGGAGCGNRGAGHRHGYRRLDPAAVGAVRHGWFQAHVRCDQPQGRDGSGHHARYRRPDGDQRGRLCVDVRSHVRAQARFHAVRG